MVWELLAVPGRRQEDGEMISTQPLGSTGDTHIFSLLTLSALKEPKLQNKGR